MYTMEINVSVPIDSIVRFAHGEGSVSLGVSGRFQVRV